MSHADNPYAAPQSYSPPVPAYAAPGEGLWRKGNVLVMHRDAVLPDRCVKSNQPAMGRLKRKLTWHHPAIFISLLVSILIYVILALVLSKRATIYIGLSEEWFGRRRQAMLIGWGMVLASVALIILGAAMVDSTPEAGWMIAVGVLAFFAGAIYGLLRARMVWPRRMNDQFIWLKGVHPEFLGELPHWPYSP
jgi:hypothetical protein